MGKVEPPQSTNENFHNLRELSILSFQLGNELEHGFQISVHPNLETAGIHTRILCFNNLKDSKIIRDAFEGDTENLVDLISKRIGRKWKTVFTILIKANII